MAEEEVVVAVASPTPTDHKRKHEDLEPDAPEPPPTTVNGTEWGKGDDERVEEENGAAAGSDESEAKRPRLEENPDGLGIPFISLCLFVCFFKGFLGWKLLRDEQFLVSSVRKRLSGLQSENLKIICFFS